MITRRRFVQGSAAAGAAVAGRRFLFGDLGSVISRTANARSTTRLPLVEDFVHTTCWIGKQECSMVARRIDGRVVKFEGLDGAPRNDGTLCPKGQAQIISLYDPNRVKTPLVRTNAKGEAGEWRRASWDEALEMVGAKVREVRLDDPSLVLWQKGRSKAKNFYDNAFVHATGATKLGHGAYCSDAGYRAVEYTVGVHGVLHPDLLNSRYVLSWGWNITNAGGNKFCWITWPRQMVQAREKNNLEIVQIDPRRRPAGPFADRWVPIRPATDLAFALALCRELIVQGFVDRDYLTSHTNSAYLVGPDGLFLRDDDGQVLVWDEGVASAVAHGEATSPALEGTYKVDGVDARTGFEAFRQNIEDYTPEWASGICDVVASEIRRIAGEFGEHAQIGSTRLVDGVEVPFRPVGIMAYHMAQQELGFQTLRAMSIVSMLVGAWGAFGGQQADLSWKIHKNYAKFGDFEIDDPPYGFVLENSKFFPINSGSPGVVAKVMQDPAKYEVERLPRMAILHHVNPVVAFTSRPDFVKTYEQFEFVAVISPWLSETADLFADVVLPAATMEKYEGPNSVGDGYVDAKAVRMPPMDPLYESRGEIDIYLDLCDRIGVLEGDGGYISEINDELGLTETEYALPTDARPEVRDIFDRWAKAEGLSGIDYFEENGIWIKGPVSATKKYGYVTDPPFGGAVHRLYGESLLKAQSQMRAKGADEIYWQDYVPLPTWRTPTMLSSPDEYDLYLISYKLVEHKQSRTTLVPLLSELSGGQRLDINPETARRLGISDGDAVTVESHHALTGETRRLETVAALKDGIRPDVVGMPHHFGTWTHPASEGLGPSPNEIFFTGEGYMAATADAAFHVRVKVMKGGGAA